MGGRIMQETALKYLRKKFPKTRFSIYPLVTATAHSGALGAFNFADRKEVLREIRRLG